MALIKGIRAFFNDIRKDWMQGTVLQNLLLILFFLILISGIISIFYVFL